MSGSLLRMRLGADDLLDQRAGMRTDRGAPLDQPRGRPLEVRAVRGRPVFEHGAVLVLRVGGVAFAILAGCVAAVQLSIGNDVIRGNDPARPESRPKRVDHVPGRDGTPTRRRLVRLAHVVRHGASLRRAPVDDL